MTEPSAPQDISRRAFDVVRRGYDQQAVRAYLHELSSLVERLQRSERELRERAERAEARVQMIEHPDEASMLELLGEETTRVLTSAKEAASDIRSKAEASAERLIADATNEAATTRNEATAEAEAVLAAARSEADEILEQARNELTKRSAEAQEAADRIREEGREAAEALREEGRRDLASAREEAETAIEAAKTEGKAMVGEAQAVRERVLRDLQVRRKKARLQVEKLNAGRERLLQAYDVVRRTIDEATNELNVSLLDARIAADAAARRLEGEPEPTLEQLDSEVSTAGLVDLPIAEHGQEEDHLDEDSPSPLSGEVPVIGEAPASGHPSEARLAEDADEGAADDDGTGQDDGGGAEHEAEAAPAPVTTITSERRSRRRRMKGFEGLPAGELTRIDPTGEDEGVRILADAAAQIGEADEVGTTSEEAYAEAEDGAASSDDGAPGAVGERDDTAPPAGDPGTETATDEPPSDADADSDEAAADRAGDVFARLRAEQSPGEGSEAVAEEAESAEVELAEDSAEATSEEPSPDAAAFQARDEALAPVDKELGRRLKRALADEQNEVLDLLRRAKPKGVDDLLPAADEHAARWAETAAVALAEAAAAGAAWAGGKPGPVADLADEFARGVVDPLRDRIDRSFAASDGNLDDVADRVRALYREWKRKLVDTSQHFIVAAYGRGVFDATASGGQVRWTVDPSTAPCPDCDDNVLAGAIAKGEEFPTGSPCAPAHTGCRCLVVGA